MGKRELETERARRREKRREGKQQRVYNSGTGQQRNIYTDKKKRGMRAGDATRSRHRKPGNPAAETEQKVFSFSCPAPVRFVSCRAVLTVAGGRR